MMGLRVHPASPAAFMLGQELLAVTWLLLLLLLLLLPLLLLLLILMTMFLLIPCNK
jgi:hypothetical protein